MKKVKHIFSVFLNSFIPHDSFYPKLIHTRLIFSLKYFILIISLFSFLFTGIVLYQYSPKKVIDFKQAIIHTLSTFPQEIEITISNGVLDSNLTKPLFLWVYTNNQPQFLFMIHTKDTLDTSHIPLPLIFLGSNQALISYQNKTTVKSYESDLNVVISKKSINQLIYAINSLFPLFIIAFYILLIILTPLTVAAGTTLCIFLSSFLVFALLRTFIPHMLFKKCFQAGMHGTHIPLIIALILFTLFPAAANVFIVTAALIFVFTLVSTYEMYSKEVGQHHV